jgi:hypothetical protein
MGKPSLIAQAALEAEVDRFRLRSIEATLLKPTSSGGYLRAETTVTLSENSSNADKLGIKGVQTPGDIANPRDEGSLLLAGTQGPEAHRPGLAGAAKRRAARPKAKAHRRDKPPTKKKAK